MKDGRFGDLAGPVGDAVWFAAAYADGVRPELDTTYADEKKQELMK